MSNQAKSVKRLPGRLRESVQASVDQTTSPIFVVGCPHSGTTILTRCLGQHSRIYAIPYETGTFIRPTTSSSVSDWHQESLLKARGVYKNIYCEKTPEHLWHLKRIFRYIPSSRIIIIERDGRDIAASLRRRLGLQAASARWVDAIETGRSWSGDERVQLISYEDLVKDPVLTLKRCCIRLGFESEAQMLIPNPEWSWQPRSRGDATHGERRKQQVAKPLFDGRGRWRTDLSTSELDACLEIVGETLGRLGYDC